MFLITLTYTSPIEQVDDLLEAHREFLRKHFASGHLVMAGRQMPRVGGVMMGMADNMEQMRDIMREDPFWIGAVAHYEIIEFEATMLAEGLDCLKEK